MATILGNPASKIEALHLENTLLGDEGATILGRGLASNSTLNKLCIPDTNEDIDPSITESGWQALFSALCSAMCRLEKLELKSSNVNDASALCHRPWYIGGKISR